jgi:hypothetical protein
MLQIQANQATVSGYIKPNIHMSDCWANAVRNSKSNFNLSQYHDDAKGEIYIYYRGARMKVISWDRDNGLLTLDFYEAVTV